LTLRELETLSRGHVDWLYAFAIVGSLPGIGWALWRHSSTPAPDESAPPANGYGWVALMLGVAAVAPLAQYVYPPSLRSQYGEWGGRASLGDFWNWYNTSDFDGKIPGSLVRFLREEIPEGRVVAAPQRFAYLLPVLTNHYIVSWGYALGTDLNVVAPYEAVTGKRRAFSSDPARSYLDRTEYANEVLELDPMFNTRSSPQERLAYLREYGVDYVVSGPIQHPYYKQAAAAYPDVLEKLFSRRDYSVFRVHRDRLPTPAPRGAGAAESN
jgi:hypothetical protein